MWKVKTKKHMVKTEALPMGQSAPYTLPSLYLCTHQIGQKIMKKWGNGEKSWKSFSLQIDQGKAGYAPG